MSLYRTENIHLLYKILLGSNPMIACVLAIRGGGQKPINTSIELVDLFTYTSGGIL